MKISNRRLLQFCRWFLLAICFAVGGFLLVSGNSTGLGILLLLVGLWFVLDNPLESFAKLQGPCPFCGQVIQGRRQASFQCPACKEAVSCPETRMRDGDDENDCQIGLKIIAPGDTLDLHTFSPKDVSSLLDEFIHLSQKADINLVNIIHGKGSGVLRRLVRKLLGRDPRVVTFYDAPPKSGGWGATVAELKPYQESKDDKGSV